ncbi:MAG: hypothetical protein KDA41_17795, partial [Planctomycetales bacterium]|nr:hypothetical protein [Planctomycetales bacterium]
LIDPAAMRRISPPLRSVLRPLLLFYWASVVSFLLMTMLLPRLSSYFEPHRDTFNWGMYQLVRLTQCVLLFASVAATPLEAGRQRIIAKIAGVVLGLLCVGSVLTYTGVIPYEAVVAHLPADKGVSGPWADFGEDGDGVGLVSYNHAYTACQLILAFAFYLSLTNHRLTATSAVLAVATNLAVFVSASRAGFGALLVLNCVLAWSWVQLGVIRPFVAAGLIGALVAMLAVTLPSDLLPRTAVKVADETELLVSRQLTTFSGYESKNLSGRTQIWQQHLEGLNSRPYRWLVGRGFGTAIANGNNAHMLPLNIVSEMGLAGLLVCSLVMWRILHLLWRHEPAGRPFFWGTVALLLTSMTQETFYPVPSLDHFLGYFLMCSAIVIGINAGAASPAAAEQEPAA